MVKVASLMDNLFEESEFFSPKAAIEEAGHQVETVGLKSGEIVTGKSDKDEVKIDKAVTEVDPSDYDALLIPGGYSPDKLRGNEDVHNFVRHFSDQQKPIFSICHAPQLLVEADVLKGKDATVLARLSRDVINAGGIYKDEPVVIDESGLISSRTPEDLPEFNQAIVNALNDL